MLSIRRWLKKIRKIGSHDQNDGEPNLYMSSKDMRDRQNASRVLSLAGDIAGPLCLWWSWALEADMAPRRQVVSYSLFRLFFYVFLWSGEVAAASWNRDKILSALSSFQRCV
jgi:hypothetical protein